MKTKWRIEAGLFGGWLLLVGWPVTGSAQSCVQVTIAGQSGSAFSCLNQELLALARQAQGVAPSVPLAANAPADKVGGFSETGLSQQYGQNFGKSVIPYRPPPPVFSNALH